MSENNVEITEEGLIDYTPTSEYIAAAFNSLAAMSDLDMMLLNKTDENRVRRIKRKSIRIIDACIDELYNELFDDNDEDI